jgi:murein DD-endopeptidase MepM/ murein hydrolase activator NlpD
MTMTPLERRYTRRRRAGKMLSPVRTAPTREHPLGQPVKATTPYGERGRLWSLGRHTGVDFACPTGSLAVATSWGRVVWVGERGGWSAPPRPGKPWAYGLHVIVRTANGRYDYMYAHLSEARVRVGDRVKPGTVVGLSGNTGNTTGAHVHFEARPAGGRYGSDVAPRLVRRKRK